MEKFTLNLENHKCEIVIGRNILEELKSRIPIDNCFFVVDRLLYENFQSEYLKNFLRYVHKSNIYLIDSIEKHKNISTAVHIIERLSRLNLSRDAILFGIGGGIVGDVCGFVASVYMRGIRFISIPTTLLSQVDSSIGGKNGLNVRYSKNLIGTFKHPTEIFIDIRFLQTISHRELVSGLAEVVKYGVIFDYSFLRYIDENLDSIFDVDFEIVQEIVRRSCKFKVGVVEEDEFDFSVRRYLNYGHTLGHALESVTDYSLYTHGEAVIVGMFYEACISYECGILDKEYFNYIGYILKKFKITVDSKLFNQELFYNSLLKDKKNKNKKISFILPVEHSRVLEYMFSMDEIKEIKYSRYCF